MLGLIKGENSMRFFRYRKPSINTLLGITKARRQVKKDLGIYKITKIINYPTNLKRKFLRDAGYYSEPMKILRGGLRKPGGCMIAIFTIGLMLASFSVIFLNIL